MNDSTTPFSDPVATSSYAERTVRIVPGLRDLHKMTGLLMAERAPSDGRVLVLGAGGGLELKAFADMHPNWRFEAVDPSREMLQLAKAGLGTASARISFCEGIIDDASPGPFDAATCLLTLHFLSEAERLRTIGEVVRRLKPGAPFVVAHHSFPNQGPEQDKWLARYAAFAEIPEAQAAASIKAMKERLHIFPPEQDIAMLSAAGLEDIAQFYSGLTFKGWIGYKAQDYRDR